MYAFKVWVTSVIIGALILPFMMIFSTKASFAGYDPGMVFIAMPMGFIFSIPSLAVFALSAHYIPKSIVNPISAKLIMTLIGLLMIYLPFLVIDGYSFKLDIDSLSRPLAISFLIPMVAGIWIYNMKPGKTGEAPNEMINS